ncbi:hypothetical protein [Streptomyces rubellomurinus]|uniref:hypothetical protein n=1 Tax=Streptomyces rubellomurinus (strain ATCC 31215) TaxID=359131 RepID=UPI000696CF5A|nr:hypothetical protein [Streptomyces rubellomurinus]
MTTAANRAPEQPSPRIRRAAYAGALALVPYATMKQYWALDGSWGLPAGYATLGDKMAADTHGRDLGPVNGAALWLYEHGVDVTVVLAALGIFLLLGLVRPWGLVFPRRLPLLAGRPVPRWLPLAPAWATAAVLAPVFGVLAPVNGVLAVLGLSHPNTAGFSPFAFTIAYGGFGPFGLALGAAAWSYQRRTGRTRRTAALTPPASP